MGFEDRMFKGAEHLTRKGAGVLAWSRAGTTTKASGTLPVPITHYYVAMTTGGVEALTLADGSPGQELVINLVSDGGDGTLTPVSSTGWATVVFADAGDQITVRYINATIGWLLIGAKGVLAPPVTSV